MNQLVGLGMILTARMMSPGWAWSPQVFMQHYNEVLSSLITDRLLSLGPCGQLYNAGLVLALVTTIEGFSLLLYNLWLPPGPSLASFPSARTQSNHKCVAFLIGLSTSARNAWSLVGTRLGYF